MSGAYQEAIKGLMTRSDARDWQERFDRARPLLVPALLIVTSTVCEVTVAVVSLYS